MVTVTEREVMEGIIMIEAVMAIDKGISNLTDTHNLSMSHHQFIMGQCNHPASVCFFHLIYIVRYLEVVRNNN
jgi:hypothetical protein